MRIYFSTTSSDIPKAQALMERIRDAGHTITLDWTEGFDREHEMGEAELAARAQADIDGACTADLVLVYMQPKMHTAMTGAAIEMGAALGRGIPVVVVEEETFFTHFFKHHPGVTMVPSFDAIILHLAQYTPT